jgi:hypothetical protein
MCWCFDANKFWGWMIGNQMKEAGKIAKKPITHSSMVGDIQRLVTDSALRGSNTIHLSQFRGDVDIVFIERFWRQTGIFLETMQDRNFLKFHRVEHV